MGLITYKPTTPSYRKTVKIDKSQLFKGRPEKSLIQDLQPNSGRNNTGKITIRHRSGGHKKKYRIINFKIPQPPKNKGKPTKFKHSKTL